MKRALLSIVLVLSLVPADAWGITRTALITEANSYKDYAWTCRQENLQDPDNDREDNRTGWPYKIDTAYTGEAYAWNGWKDGIGWGGDTLTRFADRIGRTTEKWIAGAAPADVNVLFPVGTEGRPGASNQPLPTGYKGYTGLDCSGFISRMWHSEDWPIPPPNWHLGTGQLKSYSKEILATDLQPGDILLNPGEHVALFKEWVTPGQVARIIHASKTDYDTNATVWIVNEDRATVSGSLQPNTLDARAPSYTPRRAFAKAKIDSPVQGEETGTKPKLKGSITSATPIVASSIRIGIESATRSLTIPNSELAISANTDNTELTFEYQVTDADGLGNGTNTLSVYAMNEIGLEETEAIEFIVDAVAPEKPAAVAAQGGTGKALITWAAPARNADGSNLTDLAGYRVYYSTNPQDTNPTVIPALTSPPLSPSTLSREISGLDTRKDYFFAVKAVDEVGNLSEFSDMAVASPTVARWVHPPGRGPSGSYESISAALWNAGRGTVIMVGPGVYQESELNIGGGWVMAWDPMDITLKSERGPGVTIIEGDGSREFAIRAADRTKIIGFTIRDGGDYGIGCFFDEDVLVANNIFVSNEVGVYVGGQPTLNSVSPARIYNNVFIGDVHGSRGIEGVNNYRHLYSGPWIDIRNNIFQGRLAGGGIGIKVNDCTGVVVEYNDFRDLEKSVYQSALGMSHQAYTPIVRSNFTFDPGFVAFSVSRPEAGDYRLGAGSRSRDAGSPGFWYSGRQWVDCDGTRADLGAYGGPFAYVDNDPEGSPWHGIPDCLQPRGVGAVAAVMTNTADAPVILQAQNQTADLAYRVVDQPQLGALGGTAPDLLYSSGAVAGQDGLTFTVSNAIGESDPATVSIRVKDTNTPPAALDQSVRIKQNAVGVVTLQGADADGDELTFAVDVSSGQVGVSCPNPPTCYLFPSEGFLGTTSLTFHANDGFMDSPTGTVTIHVEPSFSFVSPGTSDAWMNADTFTVSWNDDPAGTRLISLYAGEELLAADIAESDPANSLSVAISSLPEGAHTISAVLSDGTLFEHVRAEGSLRIDRTAPRAWATAAGGVYSPPLPVALSSNDSLASIYYTLDGSEPTTNSSLYSAYFSLVSDQTMRFVAVDPAGNRSEIMREEYRINSAPTAIALSGTSVPENRPAGWTVGILSTTDPDAGDTFTYSLLPEDDTDYFYYEISGDQLRTTTSFDHEERSVHLIRVRSTDQDGFMTRRPFTINVTDLNEAPSFTAGENQTVLEDAGAQSVAGWATGISPGPGSDAPQSVVFVVSSDNPALFSTQPAISPAGTLSYTPAANASGSATATVRLRDNGGTANGGVDTSDPKTLVIAVLAVNDAPANLTLSTSSVAEGQPSGTLVGALDTEDEDVGDAFAYLLVPGAGGTDNALFRIEGNTLKTNAVLACGFKSTYAVRMRSTDQGGLWSEKSFTLTIPAHSSYALWTRSDLGKTALWRINPATGVLLSSVWVGFEVGAGWQATSYAREDDTTGYVLWSRSSTGQAAIWKINPVTGAVIGSAWVHSTSGVGAPWQATSYERVDATTGYVLWTRGDTGQAALWRVNPSTLNSSIIPQVSSAYLHSSAGVGGPWQATSYKHVNATTGYVLWTRSDTGQASLWKVNPGTIATGTIPIVNAAYLPSASGVGSPWQASGYDQINESTGYVLWTRSDTGQAALWRVNPGAIATGTMPGISSVYLNSASGVGGPWQAGSHLHDGP